jgi:prephenate dehydrogenase
LFENSKVLICPFSDACKPVSPLSKEDKEREYKNFEILKIFWSSIGGTIKTLPINQHDNFFAGISHFPHLVSFCLALILSRSDFASQALSLHGGGLRDTTRIAGASPDLWSDIIFDNKEEVVNLIEQWKINWNELSDTLKNSDKDEFKKLLLEASDWRNNFEK